jgi:hypothetical protein
MKTEGRGNAGLMDNEENQRQVSLVVHSPWKSLRDSHISTAPTARGKVENQGQVSHFPTCCFSSQNQTQKGGLAADRFAPASRLILELENARGRAGQAIAGFGQAWF